MKNWLKTRWSHLLAFLAGALLMIAARLFEYALQAHSEQHLALALMLVGIVLVISLCRWLDRNYWALSIAFRTFRDEVRLRGK